METAATSSPAPDQYARIASPLHTFLVLAAQMGLALRAMARLGHMGAAANMDRVQIYERTLISEWFMLALVLLGVWWTGSSLSALRGYPFRSFLEGLLHA